MSDKICPMRLMAVHGPESRFYCVKEKCMWWVEVVGLHYFEDEDPPGMGSVSTFDCAIAHLAKQ